jgi:RHH-type transcriptional regulator, proline utilization regulon repressor / proline dehydrogenase / delta 1-pyrroline-5-carboxylate dehydrogenase
VDANFKRMVEYGCRAEQARAVHLGIATHNLFDVAHGLLLRAAEGVEPFVEFEMLEGMANHQARAVQARAGGLLLYAPVVRAADFHSAIAYLVRRLDENTAPDNFLRHVFGLEETSADWARERDRFLSAFDRMDGLSDAPRQRQDRAVEARAPVETLGMASFANEPDTDWSVPANRAWIDSVVARWRARPPETIPLQISGALVAGAGEIEARDRSRPERIAYRHALADVAKVDRALDVARAAQPGWAARAVAERRSILEQAARVLSARRGDLIGAMIVDGAKTVPEADPEVSEAIDFARYYPWSLEEALRDLEGARMEPLGVVVVAPPWNFPLSIPASGVLAALAAGNCVLLKPAPEAVLVGWQLALALWDGGVPREALQFVPCPDGDVGRALVTDPRVDAVVLTGSVETARRFLDWRPELRLFAETSGKNAVIVTALADRDQAIRDLVRSAFGHNGQKCSAASLAICEAEVYDDAVFRRQLRDAAASLEVGSAWEISSRLTPLTQPPGSALQRALSTLDPGEEWLLEPRCLSKDPPLWSPGIKVGVLRGSFFHVTECFGPVLGLMRAESLDEALELANGTPFGLTSGLQSLDDREIKRWVEGIEAGSLYVNRAITGALVGRHPFGGWKASSVGAGAKVGGPNYVLRLAHWRCASEAAGASEAVPAGIARLLEHLVEESRDEGAAALLRAGASSYARAWASHFGCAHDPMGILGERNVFRYRPCRDMVVRAEAASPEGRLALAQVLLAARICEVPAVVSLARGEAWPWLTEEFGIAVVLESEATLTDRLRAEPKVERLRVIDPIGSPARAAAHEAGVTVLDEPVITVGRLELRWYLREQTVARVTHRYGNVMNTAEARE